MEIKYSILKCDERFQVASENKMKSSHLNFFFSKEAGIRMLRLCLKISRKFFGKYYMRYLQ